MNLNSILAGGISLLILAGCGGEGYRDVGGGDVQTFTTSDDPMVELNHKATVDFWKSLRKAMEVARRRAKQDNAIFDDWFRYATGISLLHAGQGGNVAGTTYTWSDLYDAVSRLDLDTRRNVSRQITRMYEDAVLATLNRPEANAKFKSYAKDWKSLTR